MEVIETRTVKVLYTVMAENAEQAADFAVTGETYSEDEYRSTEEVINRSVYSSPVEVNDPA